jgi:hypothetical protein
LPASHPFSRRLQIMPLSQMGYACLDDRFAMYRYGNLSHRGLPRAWKIMFE